MSYSKRPLDFAHQIIAATQPKIMAQGDYIDRFAVIYHNEEFHVCLRIQ